MTKQFGTDDGEFHADALPDERQVGIGDAVGQLPLPPDEGQPPTARQIAAWLRSLDKRYAWTLETLATRIESGDYAHRRG